MLTQAESKYAKSVNATEWYKGHKSVNGTKRLNGQQKVKGTNTKSASLAVQRNDMVNELREVKLPIDK